MEPCPPLNALATLLDSDSVEDSPLVRHLDECELCGDLLDHLAVADGDWQRWQRVLPSGQNVHQEESTKPPHETVAIDVDQTSMVAVPEVPGYRILGELGRGGMGIVYLAKQHSPNREVALKMLLPQERAGLVERARFRKEIDALAKLEHPGIVQIYHVGEYEGRPYFSMELIRGGTLGDAIRKANVDPSTLASHVESLANTMHVAHCAGILHRDLKPSNVLLTGTDSVKVVDFGLVKHLETDDPLTETGIVAGTLHFLAPEQLDPSRNTIGPSVDVYSMGAILYEGLCGLPPFSDSQGPELLAKIATREPLAPSRIRANVPRDLETICLKCLHKEPTKRYGSAQELALDLVRFREGRPIHARRAGPVERCLRWGKRRPALAALLLVSLFALLTLVATSWFYTWNMQQKTERLDQQNQQLREAHAQAEQDRKTIEAERQQVGQQLDRVNVAQYSLRLSLARHRLLAGNASDAQYLVNATDETLRGWEYRHLQHLLARRIRADLDLSPLPYKILDRGVNQPTLLLGDESSALVWNWETKQHQVYATEFTSIYQGHFHDNGQSLLLWGSRREGRTTKRMVQKLDAVTGAVVEDWEVEPGYHVPTGSVEFGKHSGVVLAKTAKGQVELVRLDTGESLATLPTDPASDTVHLRIDKSLVAVGQRVRHRYHLTLWDLAEAKPKLLWKIEKPVSIHVPQFAFHEGHRDLVVVAENRVSLFDVRSGKRQDLEFPDSTRLRFAKLSPDRRVLAVVDQNTVELWSRGEQTRILTPLIHEFPVRSASFGRDGRTLVTTSGKGKVRCWNLSPIVSANVLASTLKREFPAGVAWSSDGKWLARAAKSILAIRPVLRIELWDVATHRRVRSWTLKEKATFPVLFFSDDNHLNVRLASKQFRWNLTNFTQAEMAVAELKHGTRSRRWIPSHQAFLAMSRSTATHNGKQTKVHEVLMWTAAPKRVLFRHILPEPYRFTDYTALVSENGERVVWMSFDAKRKTYHVEMFSVKTGKQVCSLPLAAPNGVQLSGLSPDGNYVSLTERLSDTQVRLTLWDMLRQKKVKTLTLRSTTAPVVRFWTKAKRLVTATQRNGRMYVQLWDDRTYQKLLELEAGKARPDGLRWSKDNATLIGVDRNQEIRLWASTP